jgi:signal transduction histidine kinase
MVSGNELEEANAKIERIEYESKKLLEAASIVLQSEQFPEAAKAVFDIAKDLTGASSGYVALLSEDGSENEVLFLDAGGLPCTVDENLPMPIRGLREVAYRENRPAYDNGFMSSKWVDFMPEGHVVMDNVLFGPLVISGRAEGLIGLANKASDFTEDDARIVMALSNLVAIGLKKSKMQSELQESQKKLSETVAELQLYASLLKHDLSNDLQLIISEIELAQMKTTEESSLKGSLMSIDSTSARMLRLLEVFNRPELIDEDNIFEVIKLLMTETQNSYPESVIRFHEETLSEPIMTSGKSLLPFVFDNLIRNSIQHVSPSVEIDIFVKKEPNKIVLDFVDNGPGIEEEIAEELFQKGVSKSGGGFGLYLCRKIMETYGGQIVLLVSGEYENRTAFRIVLPHVRDEVPGRAH